MRTRLSGSRRVDRSARPRIVSSELLRGRSQEISDAVARRAYEIFEQRGRMHGRDADDWRQAESELLYQLTVTVADTDRYLTIEAEVPDFSAGEIEVGIEPRRVTIAGERQAGGGPDAERRGSRFVRPVDLPEDVDTGDVRTTLEGGVLAVALRKAAAPKVKRRAG